VEVVVVVYLEQGVSPSKTKLVASFVCSMSSKKDIPNESE
jgi:hypothetical protein